MGTHGTESMHGEAAATSADAFPQSKYAAMCLAFNQVKVDAFRATLRLKVADILAKAEAEDGKSGLSAEEIVERLPGKRSLGGPEAARNLKRLLEPLVQDGLYARSVVSDGKVVYSITDLSRWFVEDNKFNILASVGLQHAQPIRKAFDHIEHAIFDNKSPFEIANGILLYEYVARDSQFRTMVSAAMTASTNFEEPQLLEALQGSGVLRDAKTLVDIGGGVGSLVPCIVNRNPHIHGINFDLPQVVDVPEAVKGVEHIGGSFFESVPSGDVMILKAILHNYGDEESIRILQKCYEALPQRGKVLIVEYLLPEVEEQNPGFKGRWAACLDVAMLGGFGAGRERSLNEYDVLIRAAGFAGATLISIPECISIIQAYKSK